MMPGSLFARTATVIALVSIAFQLFTIAVITALALLPLGRRGTDDLAALMIAAARDWQATPAPERARARQRLIEQHALQVQDPVGATRDFTRLLPYFHFLESALSARAGQVVVLRQADGVDGRPWYWAELPTAAGPVRVGFPGERVAVQPSLALMIIFVAGAVVTVFTATALARWLITPLARLARAMQPMGQGRRPPTLPETGAAELATLAREFNRVGAQVEELLTNRTTVLVGISHDLRSPLARMRLALGMLAQRSDPDLIERLGRDIDEMNALIGRSLELGRDLSELEPVEVDLCELVDEIAEEQRRAGARIRSRPCTACCLRIRPLALRRVLSNLVDNAVRYGAAQPVDIACARIDRLVEIRIEDRGPGIPPEEREAVFRPFYRLDKSRSPRTGGSGLGLAIVRQLACSHGWTVDLRPRDGGGTVARVQLPVDETRPG